MSSTPSIDAWWDQLERLERVLMCVGPDEVCCEGMTPRQTSILRTLIDVWRSEEHTSELQSQR